MQSRIALRFLAPRLTLGAFAETVVLPVNSHFGTVHDARMTHTAYARCAVGTLYLRSRTLPSGERRFDVKYRRGGRYTPLEHGGTFATKREANIRRDLIGDMLAAGLNPKLELRRRLSPEDPLRLAAAGWVEARRAVKPRTREAHREREKIILERFGDRSAAEIEVPDVIEWIGELEKSYSPGSIRNLVGSLRLMLDHVDGPNPVRDRRVQLPRYDRPQVTPPSAERVLEMLHELPERYLGTAATMELLGSRVSETIALEPRDLFDGAIRFRSETTKRAKSRIVPAPEFLVDALHERLPLPQNRQATANVMRSVGGPNPHSLRHRRATLWYQQGVGLVELAQRLGHSRASMSLDVYAHVEPLEEIPTHELVALFR